MVHLTNLEIPPSSHLYLSNCSPFLSAALVLSIDRFQDKHVRLASASGDFVYNLCHRTLSIKGGIPGCTAPNLHNFPVIVYHSTCTQYACNVAPSVVSIPFTPGDHERGSKVLFPSGETSTRATDLGRADGP